MNKKIIVFLIIIIFIISSIFIFNIAKKNLVNNTQGVAQIIKNIVPSSIKDYLKETLFKSKYLEVELLRTQKLLNKYFLNNVSIYEKKLNLFEETKITSLKGKQYNFKKINYPFPDHNAWGKKPPGYLDIYKNFLIVVSGQADFMYINLDELDQAQIDFKFIKTNFKKLIDKKNYILPGLSGPRDIEIINDEIYISYVDKDSCNKLSIAKARINFDFLKFEKFFSWESCFDKELGLISKDLLNQRSGGRIRDFDSENLLFTIGDYNQYSPEKSYAQKLDSIYGSVIKINKLNKNYSILSKGHRNQQGMYFDKNSNFILATEHGPDGGDELNIIDLKKEKIENYGWPISSYGEHYPSTSGRWEKINKLDLFKKLAPLNKSHSKYGFVEPIINWTPSIGISEIINIPQNFDPDFTNDYFIGAMGNVIAEGDQTIHHVRFDNFYNKINFEDKLVLKERVRDMVYDYDKNLVILMLGSSPSLGLIFK